MQTSHSFILALLLGLMGCGGIDPTDPGQVIANIPQTETASPQRCLVADYLKTGSCGATDPFTDNLGKGGCLAKAALVCEDGHFTCSELNFLFDLKADAYFGHCLTAPLSIIKPQ